MGAWFMMGSCHHKKQEGIQKATQTVDKESISPAVLQQVRVQSFRAQIYPVYVHLSGTTQADKQVILSSRIEGIVKKILVPKGKFVTKGTPLIKLEDQDYFQKLERATSQLKYKKMQFGAASKLAQKNYQSPISVAGIAAELEEAKQSLKQAELNCSYLVIRAPFDGLVNNYDIEEGSTVSANKEFGSTFISLDPLIMTVFVTEQVFPSIRKGQKASVTLGNNVHIEGVVKFLSAISDQTTKTFKMEIAIPNPHHELAAGMTGTVRLEITDQKLHKISPAYLTLSDEGVLGVKIVEGGIAKFKPIHIAESTVENVLVTGLPDEVTIITLGQEAVKDGDAVTPIFSDIADEKTY